MKKIRSRTTMSLKAVLLACMLGVMFAPTMFVFYVTSTLTVVLFIVLVYLALSASSRRRANGEYGVKFDHESYHEV